MRGHPGARRDAGAPVLEGRALSRRLGGRQVVDAVSLSVGAGEVVGLLGANGAGKSTTFALLVGLLAAEGGEVLLDGEAVGHLPLWRRARRGLAYLPQASTLFFDLTAADNLRVAAELAPPLRQRGRAAQEAAAASALARFGLARVADTVAERLSGGERRRLEIARALVGAPRVLLLDEPFAGVDPIAVADIQRALAEVSAAGVGVLMTDHNVREALSLCGRAYLIAGGRVEAAGTPTALTADPMARALYFGERFRL